MTIKREKIDKLVKKLLNISATSYDIKGRYIAKDDTTIEWLVKPNLVNKNSYELYICFSFNDYSICSSLYNITEDQYLKLRERKDEIENYIENLRVEYILNEIN